MPFSTGCRRLAGFIFCSLLVVTASFSSLAQTTPPPTDPRDTLRILAEEEQRRTMDPALGRVPYERLEEARKQLLTRKATGGPQTQGAIPNVTWQERGPSNAGGRTRALLFDLNDPTHKKVWAGSVAGGLWYTNDITDANAGWTPVSDAWENTIVTALASDPSNPQIMYAGTGDYYNNRPGGGIWKTTDGGANWVRLNKTIPGGNAPAVSRAFDYIQRVVVNSSGQVFVGTQYGVVRSVDGGTTWSYALAPNQAIGIGGTPTNNYYNDKVTDLEIGTDGILYAAFFPSRVFRSNDANGTAWTEITPPGTSGERTELALAPSTSGNGQVLYGVSRAYNNVNYNQDIKWFKKSVNGGISWTDVIIPTDSYGGHFTNGYGYYALNLAVNPTDPNKVYAGGYNWYRSANGGSSWSNSFTSSYISQHGIWFEPGGSGAALASDNGISWSSDWNTTNTTPLTISRNKNYRVGEAISVAMKASAGSPYLLENVRPLGFTKLVTNETPGVGTLILSNTNGTGLVVIDEDDPTMQLFRYANQIYRYDGSSLSSVAFPNSTSGNDPLEYDSPANTLYTTDYVNGGYAIRKMSGVGSTITTTLLSLTALSNPPTFIKLSKDRATLFLGSYNGKLYKVTNLSQSAPSIIAIDNGAFSQNTTVSSIDVGATDNELLVTFSNYGVQSVWYTSDGGQTWVNKDQSNYGLPDMPVWGALFNPQNWKQVLLATELGIWSTNDITATNPGWQPTSNGLGSFRVNQLRYRASDGRMAAATTGRGVFTSDALAIPYTLPTLTLTGISNATLCAGSTFTVSFTKSGPAMGSNNKYEVWISDANGDFSNMRRISSGADSPVTVTLTNSYTALPYGTNYRVKVIATDPEVETGVSDALAIGNLGSVSALDRTGNNGNSVCTGSQVTVGIVARDVNYNNTMPDSYEWYFNGTLISGATSQTITAQQPGNYTSLVKQAGCSGISSSYALSVSANPSVSLGSASNGELQCDNHPLKLFSYYVGETARYQWTLNGADITGAAGYTYVATQTGNYSFRLVDGSCASTAYPVYFQFGRSLNANVFLSGSLSDSLLCSTPTFQSVVLTTTLPSANDFTVQWFRNGEPISNASSSYYYANQPGAYSILLKQGNCQTRSNAVVIGQTDQLKVYINYSYGTKSACPGETRYLYSSVSNYASYLWQRDGVDIPGANTSQYAATLSGNYTVRIQRGNCFATSAPLSLTFSNTIQPKIEFGYFTASESCTNTTIRLRDNYNLNGYRYQWLKNSIPINGAIYTNYSASQSGIYSLSVTNGSCTGLSKEVYANVGNGKTSKPTLYQSPTTRQLCLDNAVSLTASTYYGSLQWKRNGVILPGFTRSNFYATQSGLYSVVSQDGSCTAESDPVEVKIGEPTTAQLTGNALVSSGTAALLPVSFTGPAPWSFTLTNGQSVTATYQNPYLLAVAPSATTTYALSAVNNACGFGTVSGNAVVTVGSGQADVSLSMAVSNRTPKLNDLVEVLMTLTNSGPQEAVGVQAQSRLPAGLEFVESSSPGVSVAGGVVTANAGTLPVNGVSTLSFRARVTQPGTLATAAQVTAAQTPDPDSQPNSGTGDGQDDTAQADLRTADATGPLLASANPNQIPLPRLLGNQPTTDPATADLSLSLSTNALSPKAGDVISATLTVSNRGGSAASSVVVQTVLPNGWSLSSSAGLVVSGQTVKGYVNQLAAGQSATVVLPIRLGNSGLLQAQILDMGETDPDSTPGNGFSKGEDDEATTQIRVQ